MFLGRLLGFFFIIRIIQLLLIIVVIGFIYEFIDKSFTQVDLPYASEISKAKKLIIDGGYKIIDKDYKLSEVETTDIAE